MPAEPAFVGGANRLRVSGRGGTLRAGGRPAATLGRWHLAGDATGWTLTGELVAADRFWLEWGGPYELRLPWGGRSLRWRAVEHHDTYTLPAPCCPGKPGAAGTITLT